MFAICGIALVYFYVQHDFLCPGWMYQMLAIYNIAFIYFHVRHTRKIDLSVYAQDEYGR